MRLALNLVFLHERSGGAGTYARELLEALVAAEPELEVTAFVSRELPAAARARLGERVQWVEFPVRTSGGPPGSFALATAAQWAALPAAAARRRIEVIHGLANVAPLWAPGAAVVVTLLDLVWLAHPETMTPAATRGMVRVALPSVRRAGRVIAISQAAKQDMVARLGLAPERIDVTPLAARAPGGVAATAEEQLRKRLALGSRAVALCVSASNPHKNLGRLLEGFAALPGGRAALVLAGAPSPHRAELERRAVQLGIADRVRFLDWVPEEDLEGLYRLAEVVAYPSLMEGFGLPVLEAMQRDKPVACSATSAVGEVAGAAAELFDPLDPAAIAAALQRLLADSRRRGELVELGRQRAREFTWRRTAELTLASYRRALAERARHGRRAISNRPRPASVAAGPSPRVQPAPFPRRPPLRVGFNLAYLVEDSGGSGTYARSLIPELLQIAPGLEVTAWIGASAPASLTREPWADEVRWVRLPVPGVGTPWHLWHELAGIGADALRRRLDVVHGLANLVPVIHPRVATVVTILDVIWIHHPEAMDLRARAVMRTLAPLCGHTATRVVAISEAAAEDVSQTLHIPRPKFDVTPLGVEQRPPPPLAAGRPDIREELGLGDEPLVLCVAAKRAHKNLDGLIRAIALIERPHPQLVLPGSPNEYEQRLRALAGELGVEDRVHFPGWITQPQLEALYAAAGCFVLPSFQEGFGLPVLEAMRHGVPVACSGVSSLPEVAGDAALLFDPASPQSMAGAISRLLSEPELARELVQRGHSRCRTFTWRRTAELTLASYARALGGG